MLLPVLRSDVSFCQPRAGCHCAGLRRRYSFPKGQIVEYGCILAPHDRNIEVSCSSVNNIPHLQTVATPSGKRYFVDEWNRHGNGTCR